MLTTQQIQQYQNEGYTLATGIFTPEELDLMESELDAIINRLLKKNIDIDATWRGDWKKDIPVKTQIHNIHDVQMHSAAWSRVLSHDRFTQILSDLIGPNVQLHHTKAFVKPPEKGSGFPMHQDYPYFPHAKHTMAAAVIHLTDATEEMGCLCVYPGTHKLGPMPTHARDETEYINYLDPKKYPVEKATQCVARRGDVVIFNYLTIHGSGVNRSSQARKTVLFQFRDPTDLPTKNIHDDSNAQGMMLRGINPLEDQ